MRYSGVFLIVILLAVFSVSCQTSQKRVLVIHSYSPDYAAYPEYNRLIEHYFHRAGMKVRISFFYLDCERYDETKEIERAKRMLDSITPWQPDIILLNDDQATYSTLKSYHPLLKRVPLVFTGVNYPNWPLLKEYTNITGFRDKIDFRKNLELISELTDAKVIYTILDYTFLDKKTRADISKQLKDGDIISNMEYHLSNEEIKDKTKKGKIIFSALAIRAPLANWQEAFGSTFNGVNVFWSLSKYNKSPYLQTKFDYTTETVAGFSAKNRFTAINEMFGCGYNFLAGYMTPLYVQADDLVRSAVRILKGEKPEDIPFMNSRKEYLMDWVMMQKQKIKPEDIPDKFRIINMPFKVRYPIGWTLMMWGSVIGLSAVFISLLLLYTSESRKKREISRALKDEQKLLALAIKGSKTYAWKIEKNILIFEKAFQETHHLPAVRLSLEEFSRYIHPNYRQICDLLILKTSEVGENRMELRCDFTGKGYSWWELRYSIIENTSEGKNIAGLLLDIEEYKQREQELIEARELAEQAELKESFLANMSHEIRTPLNAIVGFSNILASANEPIDKHEQKQYVDLINSNSELLLKLINDILEISRIESGYMSFEFSQQPLLPLLNEVYQTHKMLIPPHLQFLQESDPVAVQLYTDKNRLTQVLTNFISNACKFTKEGYILLGFRYLSDKEQVEIYVEDSGIGIPRIEQKMIFSRFYKQNEFAQGTGLGLSICRVIIEKLHGEIGLQSQPGQGSRFSVYLKCEKVSPDRS